MILVGPQSQAAPSGEAVSQFDGPNIVWYEQPAAESRNELIVRDGTGLGEEACAFSGTRELNPGESVREIEIAFDPAGCDSLVRVEKNPSPRPTLPSGSIAAREQLMPSSELGDLEDLLPAPPMTPGVQLRKEATTYTYLDEPARWAFGVHPYEDGILPSVNTARSYVQWNIHTGCIPPGAVVGFEITWLDQSGWERVSHEWRQGYNCAEVWSEIFAHFRNRPFCKVATRNPAQPDTEAMHWPNGVSGKRNGTSSHGWYLVKTGGCSDWLRWGVDTDNRWLVDSNENVGPIYFP